ncbi:MAG TPA: hypothetical protein VNK89_03850, partial [Thermoflexus sp.]|nr:hypothetical protein [Thermoflexus sp.]
MLPVVTGARPAALQALIYTGILAALGLAPFLMGAMGRLYLAGSLLLNAWLLGLALRLWRDPS